MYLVQILLPLHDDQGRAFAQELYAEIRKELTARFGGLTAYTRSPAEGIWKPATEPPEREPIVVYEVMTPELDRSWWVEYRMALESRLSQDQIVLRATPIILL